ncbi:MAG: ATP-binding cassette domain-containing protein [Bacteroidia bacterium]|nr:ATP-binding cassette domain-containing protein [Bacteroidia bacterium]
MNPEPSATAAATPPPPIATLQGVGLDYHGKSVLEGIDLTLGATDFTYLIGRTGAGKSSLLRLLYADLKPTRGTLTVAGHDLTRIAPTQVPYLRRRLGIVFQNFELLPDRTVGENITFAMKATGWADRRKIKGRLSEVLMLTGLTGKIGHLPHQLSGGEQQRTAIARALVNQPQLLIADEPTGNLDPEVGAHILEILRQIHRTGTAILMATHNYELLRRYPGRMLRLKDGQLHELDAPPPATA